MSSAEPIPGYQAILGEGPLGHEGVLFWVDIEERKLLSVSGSAVKIERNFPFRVTAIAPCCGLSPEASLSGSIFRARVGASGTPALPFQN